jgi:putative hydrolase of the HAD superfamily
MFTQHLLFDLDDTLIHCNRHFISTRDKFSEYVINLFDGHPVTKQMLLDTQNQVDIVGVEKFGLGRNRFPESLVETYRLMSAKYGRPASEKEENEIRTIGFSVYEYEVELYPYAMETLQVLKEQGHHLYLYSGGDYEIQTQKVLNAGLDMIFPEDRRFITEHKNTLSLKKIIKQRLFQPQTTWVIGNSPRSDIRPALELGLHAIHLPDQFGWDYDQVQIDVPAKRQYTVLSSIRDVPDAIRQAAGEEGTQHEDLG